MDKSSFVLGLLETVLGKVESLSIKTSDASFYCPFCNHKNPKLVVNTKSGMFNCWTCPPQNPTKGKNVVSLLKKLQCDKDTIDEMKTYFSNYVEEKIDSTYYRVTLPKEYKSVNYSSNLLEMKRVISFLSSRGITEQDVKKYNIGYCSSGRYADKVIIPSYDSSGNLNYFIARSILQTGRKMDAPSCDKNAIIGFEHFINWDVPVILCEGAFDAITIKRNAIPLFGKTIPRLLMQKLVESKVKTVYIALDSDAISDARKHARTLLSYGKEVYFIKLEDKDPNELGFKNMIRLLHEAKPYTYSDILKEQLQIT